MEIKVYARAILLGLAAALLLSVPGWAGTAVMNGTWTNVSGGVPIPQSASPKATLVEVTVIEGSPAKVVLPVDAFSQMGMSTQPVGAFGVVQLQTSFNVTGPVASETLEPGARTGPDNFNWCPGQSAAAADAGASPFTGGCATTNQGTFNGIVRYREGGNNFSGIAQMFLTGTGTVSYTQQGTIGQLGDPTTPWQVRHVPLGGSGLRVDGGSFDNQFTPDLGATAPITQPLGESGGLITVGGSTVGTTMDLDDNFDHGFSLTTGMVTMTAMDAQFPGPTQTTLTGLDTRDTKGHGRLVMVSGGLTRRITTTGTVPFIRTGVLDMTFTQAIPAASPAVVAGGALAIIGLAGYAVRRARAIRS